MDHPDDFVQKNLDYPLEFWKNLSNPPPRAPFDAHGLKTVFTYENNQR